MILPFGLLPLTLAPPRRYPSRVDQLSLLNFDAPVLSVSDLTQRVRGLLESDYRLQDLWVKGEVSNLSQPASGHLYFTLKDQSASLRCVIWKANAERLLRLPVDGQLVEVHGSIGVYEVAGLYQLYADRLRTAGEGASYQAFMELKDRLEAEGLFDPARKRPVPDSPVRIGIVTSATGAALQDVLDVLRRRDPLVEVVLASSPVQGPEAAQRLRSALGRIVEGTGVEVVLLVRGGGSMEDLAAFNDEDLARAIVGCPVPVVAGVGHETDFTIADFAADLRAPTPSAAAELVSPNRQRVLDQMQMLFQAASRALSEMLNVRTSELTRLTVLLARGSPRTRLMNARQRLDETLQRASRALASELRLRDAELRRLRHSLQAVGPAAVLERGYSIVTTEPQGEILRSVEQVGTGDRLRIRISDGSLGAMVEKIESPQPPEEH